jgi:predicted Zn-dependent protease
MRHPRPHPRFAVLFSLLLLAAGGVTSCAVNPATGARQLSFVGEDREIAMGRQSDPQIVAQMGLYPDSAVQQYVREIGLRMAAVSERPELPWTFRVLDDPTVNAFALPGGFIYVTRGILTHLTSEAQLAGILGHEIGHVTARHSVNQMSRAQLAQGLLVVGSIVSEGVREYGGLAAQATGLLFLRFGRDDELESDALGLRYMTRVGYDPDELAGVMEMLDRNAALASGGSGRLPEWLSTHPNPDNRVQRIQTRIAATPEYQQAEVVGRQPFAAQIQGMTFGQNPREGFDRDGTFHHPELAFRFDVPAGWALANGKESVRAGPEAGDALFQLRLAEGDPTAASRSFSAQDGIQARAATEETIHGFPAVVRGFTVTTDDGELAGEMTHLASGGRTYALLALSTAAGWPGYSGILRSAVRSFQQETDPEILGVQPLELRIRTLTEATTWGGFVRDYPSEIDEDVLSVINQIPVGGLVQAGPVKQVVRRN